MKLIVIRHGESEADIQRVCEGRADFPLTAKGLGQARLAAAWIARTYPVDAVYSSPLLRARQTAEAISEAAGRSVTELDDLMEFNNGQLAGVPITEVGHRYPVVPNVPAHDSVYGQETRLEFRFRAERVISRILYEHPTGHVVLVTHGGMINQLFRAFLRLPADYNVWVTTGDTGIHEWVALEEGRGITCLNSLAHLSGK